jgi:hypothetical protein
MIDIIPIAGMIFALLMVVIIGGFILLVPLSKRLGRLLELRLEERREGTIPPEQATVLLETVQALQDEVERLAERQAFTERLLEGGRSSTSSGE